MDPIRYQELAEPPELERPLRVLLDGDRQRLFEFLRGRPLDDDDCAGALVLCLRFLALDPPLRDDPELAELIAELAPRVGL